MKKTKTMVIIGLGLIFCIGLTAKPIDYPNNPSNWIEISENSEKDLFECVSSNSNETQVKFSLPGYQMETITENGEKYQKITYWNEGEFTEVGKPNLPRFSRFIAIPDEGSVTVEVMGYEDEILSDIIIYPKQPFQSESNPEHPPFTIDTDFYQNGGTFPERIAELGTPAIMRDLRVVNLTVNPFQYNPQTRELRIIKNVELSVNYDGKAGENVKTLHRKRSRFFEPIYKSTIINYDFVSGTGKDDYQHGTYLFIYPDNDLVKTYLDTLTDWKHKKGFEVVTASTAVTGTSLSSIKDYIQEAYDTWDNPPEFICIVGDAGGSYNIPTGHYSGGEGDQYYVLLEGNDILADAFIGRLSFNSITEFQTILNKIMNYEKYPYMDQTSWYRNILLVGDPSSSGQSCIITKKSIKEMMKMEHAYVYTEVYSSPFVSQMVNALNNGVLFFNYRGWLGMSGFGNSNIYNLNNDFMLPVAVIPTCGTGDFEGTYDCETECFLKAGTPGIPKGGIAAIGTATLSTHTSLNNCLDGGVFYGIYIDKINNMGSALVRGKLNVYLSYPANPNSWVDKYAYWNNLMGDPGMEIWTEIPQQLNVMYSNFVPLGSNYIEVSVQDINEQPIESAWVTILKGNDEIFETGYTDENGIVILPIESDSIGGTVNLTVTKHNFIPHLGGFQIVQQDYFVNSLDYEIDDDNIGSSSGNGNGLINPGEDIELKVILKNYGTQTANSVVATLSNISVGGWITITDDFEEYGDIASGSSAEPYDDFDFSVADNCLGTAEILFDLLIQDSNEHQWNDKVYLYVDAPNLYVSEYSIPDGNNGILDPGETAEMVVTLKNIGTTAATDIIGTLSCSNDKISIIDSIGTFGGILPNSQGNNNGDRFELSADAQIISGSQIPFKLLLTNTDGYNDEVNFIVEVGEVFVTDPLGPDEYGYYCYDSGDTQYSIAPVYSWIEIDPIYGGSGTLIPLNDNGNTGDIEIINLPFYFKFYGNIYTQITVCSNGWIAPGVTEQYSFMNWRLPGPLGPSPIIAGFWDDLKIGNGHVYYYYNSSAHYFVVEWSNLKNEYDNSPETFEVVLYDSNYYPTPTGDGEILVQYNVVNNVDQGSYSGGHNQHGEYATVGLEDHTSTIGLEYTYSNQYPTAAKVLENEMALLFTTKGSEVQEPPVANITPDEFNFELQQGTSGNDVLTISNSGASNLFFSIQKDYEEVKGNGGPDAFGYMWKDSNEPNGPDYDWIDISGVGIPVSFSHNDVAAGPFDIGFDFGFYGETYSEFIINPNGWIGFGEDNTAWQNTSIPSASAPRPAILGFWDDLDPLQGGDVYYYTNNVDSLIVWYDNVIHWPGAQTGTYDFEIIITSNGRIKVQFNTVSGDINSSTIGIQNADGTIGLEVAYNENYVQNNLAIEYTKIIDWLSLDVNNGVIMPDNSQEINLTLTTDELVQGNYLCNLIVSTNDPVHSIVTIPVNLIVDPTSADKNIAIVNNYKLYQNYPNPFNPETKIQYSIPIDGKVELEIYNIKGELVRTLVNEPQSAGYYKVIWNGKAYNNIPVSSGIYFYRLKIDDKVVDTKKCLLLK